MAKKTAKKSATKRTSGPPGEALKIGERTDVGTVERLVQLMVDNDLSEIDVVDGGVQVHLKRGPGVAVPSEAAPGEPQAPPVETQREQAGEVEEELAEINSPMVGTFYSAASPDGEPFIAIGSAVTEETVVCIIEAMKVMNEIKAECDGTIAEICVKNAQPVEYGQALYRIKPL